MASAPALDLTTLFEVIWVETKNKWHRAFDLFAQICGLLLAPCWCKLLVHIQSAKGFSYLILTGLAWSP